MSTFGIVSPSFSSPVDMKGALLIADHSAIGDFEKCLSQFSHIGNEELIESIVQVVTKRLSDFAGEELLLVLTTIFILERSTGRGLSQFYCTLSKVARQFQENIDVGAYESLYGTILWMDSVERGLEKKSGMPHLIGVCKTVLNTKFLRFSEPSSFDRALPSIILFGLEYQKRDLRSHWCALCYWLSKCVSSENDAELLGGFVAVITDMDDVNEIRKIAEFMSLFPIQNKTQNLPQFLWNAFIHSPKISILNALTKEMAECKQSFVCTSTDAFTFQTFMLLHAVSQEVVLSVLPHVLQARGVHRESSITTTYIAISFLYKKELKFKEVKLLLTLICNLFPRAFSQSARMQEKSTLLLNRLLETKWILGDSKGSTREIFATKGSFEGLSEVVFVGMVQELIALLPDISASLPFHDAIRSHFVNAIISEIVWLVRDATDRKVSPRGKKPLILLKKTLCRAAFCVYMDIREQELKTKTFDALGKLAEQSTCFTPDLRENIVYDKEKGLICILDATHA
jgi:hypothetical protein